MRATRRRPPVTPGRCGDTAYRCGDNDSGATSTRVRADARARATQARAIASMGLCCGNNDSRFPSTLLTADPGGDRLAPGQSR